MTSAPADFEELELADLAGRVVGWVGGEPVPLALVALRLADVRGGSRSGALPVPGTREARQLRRWVAHVVFTELVCVHAARRMGLGVDSGVVHLDDLAAVQLGSITAAAWQGTPAVGAVFEAVTSRGCSTTPSRGAAEATSGGRWRVRHRRSADPGSVGPLLAMGWTDLGDLPLELARAVRVAPLGQLGGPVRSAWGWHWFVVDDVERADEPARLDRAEPRRSPSRGERLREFARWLDAERAAALVVAPGFEHPGDPRQPDNTHRH